MTGHKIAYPHPFLPETKDEQRPGHVVQRIQQNFEAITAGFDTFGGTPFVTVAAANTNAKKRRFADYKCTGTDDQNTVKQALLDGYYNLFFLPGLFEFTGAPYQYMDDLGLGLAPVFTNFQGFGRSTVIHIVGSDAVAFYPGLNDEIGATVSNMAFYNESDGADTVIEAGNGFERVLLRDLYFWTPDDASHYAGAISSSGGVTMENIEFGFFRTVSSAGWAAIDPDSNDIIQNVICTDFHGGEVIDASSDSKVQILNCHLAGNECVDAAIRLSSSTDCLLQGCTVTGTTGGTADVLTTAATRLREAVNLIGTRA